MTPFQQQKACYKKENPVKTPGFCQKPFGWLNSLVHCSVPWFFGFGCLAAFGHLDFGF
jgi:hypothetical protein